MKIRSQPTGLRTFASFTSPSRVQSLQRSFHLSYADKIGLKKISFPSENKKYATAQTDTPKKLKRIINYSLQARKTLTTGYNRRLEKLVQWLIEHSTWHQHL